MFLYFSSCKINRGMAEYSFVYCIIELAGGQQSLFKTAFETCFPFVFLFFKLKLLLKLWRKNELL